MTGGHATPFSAPHRFAVLSISLGISVVLIFACSIGVGAVPIEPATVIHTVLSHFGLPVPPVADPVADQIIWMVRVPRAILGLVVGVGLAVSGVVIQAVVRNSLGDPYLIGVVPGASLGAVTVIVLGTGTIGGLSLSLAAFVGGLIAFLVVFTIGRINGQWPPTRLVLSGVAIGYLISSITYFLQTIATPNQVQRVLFWSLGSLAGADFDNLAIPTAVIVVGTGWLLANGKRLNALAAGTDLAGSLGINIGRFQFQLMGVVALVSGTIVAAAGGIGFVGLVLPHLARLLVGADHRRVLLSSALLGSAFLPLTDIAARLVRAPAEIPIGVITAAIGAPFFLWLLVRTGRPFRTRARHDRAVSR